MSMSFRRPASDRNAPCAQFPLCRFFPIHVFEREVGRYWQYQDLQHRLAGSKDMRVAFNQRFEHDARHLPPFGPQQSGDRDRDGVLKIECPRLGTKPRFIPAEARKSSRRKQFRLRLQFPV